MSQQAATDDGDFITIWLRELHSLLLDTSSDHLGITITTFVSFK